MTRINTNVASLRGLRSMNRANMLLDTSMTRLSTGLKINSGKDNPAGLIASETLRSQMSAIEQSIKNSNRANNVIGTADAALGEIGGLLSQIRGLVQEGLNDGAISQSEKEANQLQIDAALSAINRISSNTSFAGDKLIDGSKAFNTSISTTDAAKISDYQINEAILGTNASLDLNATVTAQAEKAELAYFGGGLSSRATLEIGGSNGNELVFLGETASVDDIASAVNSVSDSTGVSASVVDGLQLGSENGVAASLTAASGDATQATFNFDAVAAVAASNTWEAIAQTEATTGELATTGGDASATYNIATNSAGSLAGAAANGLTIVINDNGDASSSANYNYDTNTLTIDTDSTNNDVDALQAIVEGAGITTTGTGGGTNLAANTFALTFTQNTGALSSAAQVTNQAGAATTGGVDQEQVTFTALATGTAGNSIRVALDTGAATTGVAVSGNDITFSLASGATVNDLVSILDNPQTADEIAAAALIGISVTGGGTASTNSVTSADRALGSGSLASGAAATTVSFTADTAGADGNNISVNVNRGAGADSIAVNGNAITINLQNSTTITGFETLFNGTSAGAIAARALVDFSFTPGDGSTQITNDTSSATNLTNGADQPEITITAASEGADGNNVRVRFQAASTANAATSVAVSGNDITFTLGTDASSQINATIADLQNLLDNPGTDAGALAAAALIDIAPTTGTETSSVLSSASPLLSGTFGTANTLANGSDLTTTLTVLDNRAAGSTGTLSVAFTATPSTASLGATIGTADSNGNQTITFALATDSSGNVTSTVDDLKALIAADSSLDSLLKVDGTAGEDGLLFATSATALQGGEDAAVLLTSNDYGSRESVKLSVLDGTFTTVDTAGVIASSDTGADIGVSINGQTASTSGLSATLKTNTLDATFSFNEANNLVDETAAISITGGGSLFQIGQEVSAAGQVGVGIEAVNTARLGGITGKLYELGTGNGKSLLDVGQGGVSGETLVSIIEESINRVSNLRGRLGAVQANVIDTNISTLGVALENIAEARSQIVDTDFAEETANLTRAQILSQSAISVLSIANQNPQQVLSLLG
ncbi:flagellin N-terminal helical domain-containing protein [Calycomorphotria hydatis]|uniref:Flagellin n=1 Tax=Calycomorphotria hydatis TaxID=2528027 RepID=A0A517T499_9PLAN|nr:flagellin [Calycomorphotria hydatis]QDT63195.1 B-type flagellin [Calycomorphotria hydatis]